MEKLDAKDRKILEQLEIDARQSNARIARKVHMSKDVVGYRIRRMETEGIIRRYYGVLNIAKLGFMTYKLLVSFQNSDSATEKEIIGYLSKSRHVGWLASCDGNYNLMAVLWVKSAIVLEEFLGEFLKKYAQYVRERDVIGITENHSCGKAYLFGKEADDSPDIFYVGEPGDGLDDKDRQIAGMLADNARMPLAEIAGRVGLSGEAVAYRIRQLKKRNVVQAFRPMIDTGLLGYQYYNVLFRLRNPGKAGTLFKYFKRHPNVIYFVKYVGQYDVGIDLEVRDAEELRKILVGIKDAFRKEIEIYTTVLVYKEHKLSYMPRMVEARSGEE